MGTTTIAATTLRPTDYSSATDEQLLAQYRASQDRCAFAELVSRYERELYNYLRRYLGNATLAEDAFQNTFLQLHLKCEMFEPGARLRPWLYTIATHQAIDVLRRSKRHQLTSLDRTSNDVHQPQAALGDLLPGHEVNPATELQAKERQTWIREAIGELPEHLKKVVLLAYYQGLKYREVADILRVPVGTVKSRLHAAVKRLHEAWNRSSLAQED